MRDTGMQGRGDAGTQRACTVRTESPSSDARVPRVQGVLGWLPENGLAGRRPLIPLGVPQARSPRKKDLRETKTSNLQIHSEDYRGKLDRQLESRI